MLSAETHFTPVPKSDGCVADYSIIARYADRFNINLDKDWSYREKKLYILKKFLDGAIYDNLSPFYMEFGGGSAEGGSYIKLCDRRPSVIYNMNKIIVDESVTMLFGLDHFPQISCGEGHENTSKFLQDITRKSKLKRVMLEAARAGAIGSVCVVVKILKKKFYFEVLSTQNLSPVFDPLDPEKLIELVQKKKLDGSTLVSHGYKINEDELNKFFYVIRKLNTTEEIFFEPYLCEKDEDEDFNPLKDELNSETHDFGFLPAVWIKNLPSSQNIDGACTFESILDIGIEVDYQESQLGRLFKYNADPTLVIKNPSALEGDELIKGIGILNLDEKGDAYYAEMKGKSSAEVMNYVDKLRQYALEVVRGNRTNPDKITTVQSGKAIQMLNSALIGLVNEMRITYGEDGLIPIYQMVILMANMDSYSIEFNGEMPDLQCIDHLSLTWQDWYPKSAQEEFQEEQTLTGYTKAGLMSKETAVKIISNQYNTLDTEEELKLIEKQEEEAYNKELLLKNSEKKEIKSSKNIIKSNDKSKVKKKQGRSAGASKK